MKFGAPVMVTAAACVVASGVAAKPNWKLADQIGPNDFLNKFTFYDAVDPTGGQVQYVNKQTAQQSNLVSVNGDVFSMRVDTTKVTQNRKSVRISSNDAYGDGVYMLKFKHVPTGCAVWPAFWTVTKNLGSWPMGGEIDILENVNDQYPYDLSSIHTTSDCILPQSDQTGTTTQYTNCNAKAGEQTGCRIALNNTKTVTWGDNLNKMGGGVVAMERDMSQGGNGIRVWMWDANSKLPGDVAKPGKTVNPDAWGTPNAHFAIAKCTGQLDEHNVVFDITLCGNWGNPAYKETPCQQKYGSCGNQVTNMGDTFKEAYWDVQNLYLYTASGKPATGSGSDSGSTSIFAQALPGCITALAAAALVYYI